jgi:beta-glucosidase
MKKVVAAAAGKPVVLVLLSGSALAVNWADENVPAILHAWYPGQAGGTAVADVLFGDVSPGGRLPVTFYRSVEQLPPFDDYAMKERTYRYFTGQPLYPFGHGLSYARFTYDRLRVPKKVEVGRPIEVSVRVRNEGAMVADEVVQLYLTHLDPSAPAPLRALKAFRRVTLKPRERKTVRFTLTDRDVSLVTEAGERVVGPGRLRLALGGKQPGLSGTADAATTAVLTAEVELTGETQTLDP